MESSLPEIIGPRYQMIKFSLKCQHGHEFEAWFRDGATYDSQASSGHIDCPACGDRQVRKAPMAPSIARGRNRASGGSSSDRSEDAGPVTATDAGTPGRSGSGDAGSGGEAGGADGAGRRDVSLPGPVADRLRELLHAARRHVEQNCDYVGDRFAEEARRIHHGESDKRGIYGEASDEEASELRDEGIEIARIPWPRRTDS